MSDDEEDFEGLNIIEVQIVDADEAENAAFVVCPREGEVQPSYDIVKGVCAHCGTSIFYRPYTPVKPTKICIECVFDMMESTRQ